jgi:hypothetical protein
MFLSIIQIERKDSGDWIIWNWDTASQDTSLTPHPTGLATGDKGRRITVGESRLAASADSNVTTLPVIRVERY